jgi:predicted PolB exonuclease-like 3'-5' exonuclease
MAAKKLFDHLNAITAEQDPNYFNKLTEEDVKSWSNFMINRFLSMKPEWVELIATLLPLSQTLEPEQMYKLYINVLPKGKQYLKYTKGKAEDKYEQFLIELIMKEYNCSERQANEYAEVLHSSREGRENIQYICERYGLTKKEISKLKLKI